ncbi:nucleotide exchange factor GrpE [Knoellia aerolata]|uniref:Protein GrpE n=1 Tax=Knoellia aerolata DSM 18566 TaxID=1385519 RepID=A0A0A0JY94_9MICO|nr:nucleotide exchange factor GrpE [Knoellia aerolata]KGN41714.1 heat-shock protein [Knoellia aerolata DSM 18566]
MTDSFRQGDPPGDTEPREDEILDGEVVDDAAEQGDDDSINTESVNDGEEVAPDRAGATAPASAEHPDTALAAQRLDDLQRLNAEYVNYKRRVDRDRASVQERAVRDVLESVLPVLDDIQLAREHGDLTDGPFAAIADKLEASLGKFGLVRFGAVGEVFDPMHHEALMHAAWDASNPELPTDASTTTVVQVLQPGYRSGDQVLRPARVAVADPE